MYMLLSRAAFCMSCFLCSCTWPDAALGEAGGERGGLVWPRSLCALVSWVGALLDAALWAVLKLGACSCLGKKLSKALS